MINPNCPREFQKPMPTRNRRELRHRSWSLRTGCPGALVPRSIKVADRNCQSSGGTSGCTASLVRGASASLWLEDCRPQSGLGTLAWLRTDGGRCCGLLVKDWEEARPDNTKETPPAREILPTNSSCTPLGRYGYILPSRLNPIAPTACLDRWVSRFDRLCPRSKPKAGR